ncbi:hypothetical protein [Sinimarinibacterium sp. CAU 1509]|uniref:hypothetical protein n=1 Tax=Sinimarinibacterium sp. CAU 1509 TaxID=2562283 RepID=UPI001B7F97F9|nr:hypothetical protein [Sinimarinibacterium sp. CAU 1509]
MIMGDAIEMSVLAQAKIEAWITHCKAGEGDSQIHVLEIAVELLRDAKSDFEVATYADWVGPIDGLLDNLVELAHALARRLNANTERQRASGE